MSNNNVPGSTSRDTVEWNNAWDVVRRLAAARRDALHAMKASEALAPADGAMIETPLAPALAEPTRVPTGATDSRQYARALAEIEQASAALRRAEPALEEWLPSTATHSEPRHSNSVWVLVGGIWISTVLVVAGAIGATMLLMG